MRTSRDGARRFEIAQVCGGARAFIDFAQRRQVPLARLTQGIDVDIGQLSNASKWIPYAAVRRLLINSRRVFGDPEVAYQIGLESSLGASFGGFHALFQSQASIRQALREMAMGIRTMSNYGEMEVLGTPGADVLALLIRYGQGLDPLLGDCLITRGAIAGWSTQFGMAPSSVREIFCTVDLRTILVEEFGAARPDELWFEGGYLRLRGEVIAQRVLLREEELEDRRETALLDRLRRVQPIELPQISAAVPGRPDRRRVASFELLGVPPEDVDPEALGAAVQLVRDVIAGESPDSVVLQAGRIFNAPYCRCELHLPAEKSWAERLALSTVRRWKARRALLQDVAIQVEESARTAERISALHRALAARYEEVERARQALLSINEHLERQLNRRGEALQQVREELDLGKEQLEKMVLQLRQTEAQLIHQGKMAGLGQLVAGIAHELRAPIEDIVSHSKNLTTVVEHIQRDIEALPQELEASLGQEAATEANRLLQGGTVGRLSRHLVSIPRTLETCAGQIEGLINNLRLFSQGDERVRVWIQLGNLITDALRIADTALGQRVDVEVELAPELPVFHCCPSQITQVILNMLVNAAQAAKAGVRGHVWIRARTLNPEWLRIEIEDDGMGIPEEFRPRIFEPFFTTKAPREGTGLGLSISHRIIFDEHGGRIEVESELGHGTTFIIDLPIQGRSSQ
ncbi:MAG TPA: ATP-binding protein [Polyangia bacterium]|jgi:signal transduction histidine kinase|nr:ATP-binding protein [Polyangia bacterium]